MFYGANVWDPVLIVAQIVAVQCLFYLAMGAWNCALLGKAPTELTTATLFDWRLMHISSYRGWALLVASILNAPTTALVLMFIVERAKKCLDFAATCYLIHLVVCSIYAGFPGSLGWWAANTAGAAVTALLGEWLCVRREMRDIPLSTRRGGVGGASSSRARYVELSNPTGSAVAGSASSSGVRT